MSWMPPGLKGLFRAALHKPAPPQPETPTFEQMKAVIELAEEFDRLQHLPVWEKCLLRLGTSMNAELIEAANKKYDREARMMHCDMYHAKRELIDDLQGWIESTQRERDRILDEFKEMKDGRNRNGV